MIIVFALMLVVNGAKFINRRIKMFNKILERVKHELRQMKEYYHHIRVCDEVGSGNYFCM